MLNKNNIFVYKQQRMRPTKSVPSQQPDTAHPCPLTAAMRHPAL